MDDLRGPDTSPKSSPGAGFDKLPGNWASVLKEELQQPYWTHLQEFITSERTSHEIFPPEDRLFSAFHLTPFEKVRVLLLGQDPYPTPGHAHGLCFSVLPGVSIPASLRNMYIELRADIGCETPKHGYLASWAEQGILMLNAVLTVRSGEPNSHKNKGWERFTDAAIQAVSDKQEPVVFVLWGAYAQKTSKRIDTNRHVVIQSAHPSPLSARNGFFGSKPYSKINAALEKNGFAPIDWKLPEKGEIK